MDDAVLSPDGMDDAALSPDGMDDAALSPDGMDDAALSPDGMDDAVLSPGGDARLCRPRHRAHLGAQPRHLQQRVHPSPTRMCANPISRIISSLTYSGIASLL